LRLQLLDVESKHHAPLLKSIYGILLCLPQGDAFRLLNNRLQTVCNLRDNLGLTPTDNMQDDETFSTKGIRKPLSLDKLLTRFDDVVDQHRKAKEWSHRLALQEEQSFFQSSGKAVPGASSSEGGNANTVLHNGGGAAVTAPTPGSARTATYVTPSTNRTVETTPSPQQRHGFPVENRVVGETR
jgi:hypothetical protein